MVRDDEIRSIAYSIWEQEGCPNGKDFEHWLKAEVMLGEQAKQKNTPMNSKNTPAVRHIREIPGKVRKS